MNKKLRVKIEFKPQDFWIGIYAPCHRWFVSKEWHVKIYICIIPMFPILFEWNY